MINWELLKNPMNWIIVLIMAYVGFTAISLGKDLLNGQSGG